MTAYRQSLLAGFETCPRRTLHGMAIDDDLTTGYVAASADLGSAFHAFAAEYLRTLWRQNEQQMPTQEAVEILYEVLAAGPWVLPADERDDLRWMVLGFCSYKWQPKRIMPAGTDLDQEPDARLTADIFCLDGEVRTVTGRPDVIVADPPDGLVIVDFKSGKGKPKAPRDNPDADLATGKQYLSDRGHFQLDVYGLLALRRYPQAQRATLRELHMRSGKTREASLGREELEHVERQIADHLMKLDKAIAEGPDSPLWKPRPGPQCVRACPVARSCPIPAEQRGLGALETPEMADEEAARWLVVRALAGQQRDALKTVVDETGYEPSTGDGRTVRWRTNAKGSRSFDAFDPEPPDEPQVEVDLEPLLEASVAKVKAERG